MGATVRLLDDTLVDQIAAGEVIERPANLVKELLENALDAGATSITVSVEDGGRACVRVTDDGAGMSSEDAALCVERHATSKIRSYEDLHRVQTLGFRGEALPSIGSVSRMTIVTRPKAALEGTRVVVEGGARIALEPTGCPPGTTVEVTDLFFNVPARRKFLRARQTETSRIFEVCQRVALSDPRLRLIVTSDGRTGRRYLPARSLAERAYQVFGDIGLREIQVAREGVSIEAALSPAELSRPGPRHLFLLVNGRPISDRGLARAVAFAYGDQLPPGHYPRGVVSLRLPVEEVDVNAHPQKTEVRFRRVAQLIDLVSRMLAPHLPSASRGEAYWEERIGNRGSGAPERRAEPESPVTATVAERTSAYESSPGDGLRLVAHLRQSVLVCEYDNEILVIDRAQADLRGRLDALQAASDDGLAEKHLLFPDRVEVDATDEEALTRHEALLRSLGFDWSPLGERVYAVRAVPAGVEDGRGVASLRAVLAALRGGGSNPRNAALAAIAYANAAKNGELLGDDEVRRIAASIRPEREEHRASVLARVTLPAAPDHG